jgi:hypothetical protein
MPEDSQAFLAEHKGKQIDGEPDLLVHYLYLNPKPWQHWSNKFAMEQLSVPASFFPTCNSTK